ncbi:MAG: NirD/YgiW/YdeI family stress tolerance protein [Pseudomonadota bacterium]
MIRLAFALLLASVTPALAVETTPIAEARSDAVVTFEGIVQDILDDDTFLMADETGTIPVYIGPHAMPVSPNEQIRVTGQIDDDLPRELYANALVTADGQVVTLGGRYD